MALINAGWGLSNYHGLWDSQFLHELNHLNENEITLPDEIKVAVVKWRHHSIDSWRKKKYSSIFTKDPTPLYVSKYSH